MYIKVNLLALMAQNNITPQEMSKKTGLTIQTINSIMNDRKSQLSFKSIAVLCKHLDCEVGDLLVVVKEAV